MELALSLGDNTPGPATTTFTFHNKSSTRGRGVLNLGFCMSLENDGEDNNGGNTGEETPVQLDLMPLGSSQQAQTSQRKFPFTWMNQKYSDRICDSNMGEEGEEFDDEVGVSQSPPNSSASPFGIDLSIFMSGAKAAEGEAERGGTSSRGSDEEENGMMARKKLRLTKEQSAFLEESFKEHNTLNPKQKLALAKQLNLRPRQVEVWFQNRRARTKLKQTEVDCEYLKRCCETLTEENKRLRKEVHELRALKAAKPFYMQLPATTLTMCPACERVATNNGGGGATVNSNATAKAAQHGGA